jgi:hypothetical protein
MATPMVAGTVAQLLQRHPLATFIQIKNYLMGTALKDFVNVDYDRRLNDSITPNLMLQIPTIGEYSMTNANLGCVNNCSNLGNCLMQYSPIYYPRKNNNLMCHCNQPFDGPDCSKIMSIYTANCSSDNLLITISMLDSFGDGWNGAAFAIVKDEDGRIISNAYDSLMEGYQENRLYCVTPGCYKLNVNKGSYPSEIGWRLNNLSGGVVEGGTTSSNRFCVSSSATVMSCGSGKEEYVAIRR